MFTAASFTVIEVQKQPKRLLMDEQIRKMWVCIYTMKYYPAIESSEILSFVTTRLDLDSITLSRISQTRKDKYPIISLLFGTFKKIIDTKNTLAVPKAGMVDEQNG